MEKTVHLANWMDLRQLKNAELAKHLKKWPFLGRNCEEVTCKMGWEEVPTWVCLHVHTKIRLFSSVFVDDIKKVGKKQNKNSVENYA